MDYIKIPRSLIYDKQLGEKRILFYASLLFHYRDKKECDISELTSYCGFASNRHHYDCEAKFLNLANLMNDRGYIKIIKQDKKKIAFSFESPKRNFGIIYKNEFAQILEYRKSQKEKGLRVNHSYLLLLLSHIRINMEHKPGKPVMHFSMLKTIAEKTGLSMRSVSSGIKTLDLLSIIHHEALPRYQDEDGNWHTNIKIFVNMNNVQKVAEYDWHQEIQRAKQILLVAQR